MNSNLTAEQKEQLKMAHRSNMRIEETWSLYTMFLSQDKRPADALSLAVEAVSVWADWMDSNQIEPPDIERPDFAEQMGQQMTKAFETLAKSGVPIAQFLPQLPQLPFRPPQQVDAEFIADSTNPSPEPAAPAESPTATESGSSIKREQYQPADNSVWVTFEEEKL